MAGHALQLFMRAAQRKFGIHCVVKFTVLPAIVSVTVLADFTVLALVGIVTAMAGDALGILQIRIGQRHAVTEIAADFRMLAKKFPVPVPRMVKRHGLPLLDGMTLLALASVHPCVPVVPEMAGDAFRRGIFVDLCTMTAHAAYLGVATFQLEFCILCVIKQALLPILRTVALGAVLSQPTIVCVLGAVAFHTFV